jgi:uracil phosphoribosyltransferase
MEKVKTIDHPIAQKALEYLRNRDLPYDKFRFHSDALCRLLVVEATGNIPDESDVVVIPILRAGLAMLPAALQILPKAKVGFVGLARDEETAVASEYYWKIPKITENTTLVILDPMLATGGSVHHVLIKLKEHQTNEKRLVSVIVTPEGVEKLQTDFPEVQIYAAAIDKGLDERKYIVPGLGDYGDRYFGTD